MRQLSRPASAADRDRFQRVDLHEAGDLRHEPVEQSEVAAGRTDNRRSRLFINHAFLLVTLPRRVPTSVGRAAALGPRSMDETHARSRPVNRVAGTVTGASRCQACQSTPHPLRHRSKMSRTCSSVAGLQTVRLINQQQRRRIGRCQALSAYRAQRVLAVARCGFADPAGGGRHAAGCGARPAA